MASTLSEEDFQQLQTQLIDLKTLNYTLEERGQKQRNEILFFKQKLEGLENDYQKAQKTIDKSRKIKDVEILLQENEVLQLKLQSQEDEFRLQNETLMEELSSVLTADDKLRKELEILKNERGLDATSGDGNQGNEIRRLVAENTALKKNISDMQKSHEKEVSRLMKSLRDFMADSLNETRDGDDGGDDNNKSSIQQGDKEDYDFVEVGEGEVSYRKSSGNNTSVVELLREMEVKNEELQEQIKELSGIKILLDTETEEKNILKEQTEDLLLKLQNVEAEVNKLTEKLKKKQESLNQLQSEKEKMYEQNKTSIVDLQESKDLEIEQLRELTHRLQIQLNNALENWHNTKEQSSRTVEELESQVSNLKAAVDSQSSEKLKGLEADCIVFQSELTDTKLALENFRKENFDLKHQQELKESEIVSLSGQLTGLEEKNSLLTTTLENVQKTADKRKCLLDEMAIHLQTKVDDHQREISQLTDDYIKQIDVLSRKLEDEKVLNADLEKAKLKIEDLETEVQSLDCTRGWFERRLNEAEESLQNATAHYEASLLRQKNEHNTAIETLKEEHDTVMKDLETQLEIANVQKTEFEEIIARCKQEIKDGLEDRKIHDKKGNSIMKDLKRQLQIERKRAERLQERFQELLNDSNHSRTELFKTSEMDKTETSSISSWSMMSGNGPSEIKDGKEDGNVSIQNGSSPTPSTNFLEENDTLVTKCVGLQERLSYLEENNAAMAQDLLEKTAIIQYYCMERRSDPRVRAAVDKLTVKRVLDFIKDRGDENQRKINRRLQRILEEYLTKNMHLQKDLDSLSKENAALQREILERTRTSTENKT